MAQRFPSNKVGKTARWLLALAIMLVGSLVPMSVQAQGPITPLHTEAGWQGAYYNNPDLAGSPVMVRTDPTLSFDWGYRSPGPAIPADNFSVRWTRYIDVSPGTYTFSARSDDGVRIKVDGDLVVDGWWEHGPTLFTGTKYLGPGHHLVEVEYFERREAASIEVTWSRGDAPTVITDWRGEYYANMSLSGSPLVERNDQHIDFEWGFNGPAAGVPADQFSVRWSRNLDLPAGNYRFTMTVDDGARLFVNGHTLIDAWRDQSVTTYTGDIYLSGGSVSVQMEYYDNRDMATAKLRWQRIDADTPPPISGWKGEYYNNRGLNGSPALVRDDSQIRFDWGYGTPAPGIGADDFSVRWSRTLNLSAGHYRFAIVVDDGGRLFVNGQRIIDAWRDQPATRYEGTYQHGGGPLNVVMEYYEAAQNASAHLFWARVTDPAPSQWTRYTNNRFGVSFDYPAHWRRDGSHSDATGGERYSGSDGFFAITAMGGGTTDELARNEAYHVLRPYGSNPTIQNLTVAGQEARLILPSSDQAPGMQNQSALIVRYPRSQLIGGGYFSHFVLFASGAHIRRMADSLAFQQGSQGGNPGSGAIIVQESDPGFVRGGSASGWNIGYEGSGGQLLWSRNNDKVRSDYNWGRWYPQLQERRYEVFVYIPDRYSTTRSARYWISHAGGYTLRTVDQAVYRNEWVSLGTFNFRGTSRDYVSLADVTYEPRLSRLIGWDAIKWEPR